MSTTETYALPALQLKGGSYTFTTIQILTTCPDFFEEGLIEKVTQAPQFFNEAPVVIDLQKLRGADPLFDLKPFIDILRKYGLIPIAVKGGNLTLNQNAAKNGLSYLRENKKEVPPETLQSPNPQKQHTLDITTKNTIIISEPVRSGQRFYAERGDLIVLGSVSEGAELIADGHIHVYGSLRGRALAGALGNSEARIFCQSLEAELISVAGQYKITEHFPKTCWKKPSSIFLENENLSILTIQ